MWRVELEGHDFDLDDLGQLLSSAPVHIEREGDNVFLTGPVFDGLADAATARQHALVILTLLNAGARIANPSFRPVRLGPGIVGTDSVRHVFAEADLSARSKLSATAVVKSGDTELVPGRSLPRTAAELMVDLHPLVADAAEAAELLVNECDYGHLYKVLEIVEHERGSTVVDLGWATAADRRRFTHTSSHPAASGASSRHARSRQQAPRNPMPLSEARRFLCALTGHLAADARNGKGNPRDPRRCRIALVSHLRLCHWSSSTSSKAASWSAAARSRPERKAA